MRLDLSDDQLLFGDTTARFIEERCPMAEVRRLADDPDARDPALLPAAAALGWFSFFVPEELGGGCVSGSPVDDAVIVAEARGRRVQPGPFVGTNVVAWAIAAEGTADQRARHLPGLAAGEVSAAWVVGDRSGRPEPGAVRIQGPGDGAVVTGTACSAADDSGVGLLLVSAVEEDGRASQLLVPADAPGVTIAPLHGLDPTRRFVDVHLDAVPVGAVDVLGARGSAAAAITRQVDLAAMLTAAESLGAMQHLVEITVQYAKDRIAFGRPIGSFQAVKHMLADASFLAEASAGAVDEATNALAAGRATASEIVSLTKAFVGEAGVTVAQTCLQVHGGIGFTWEHDLHFYLRRLQSDCVRYGDPAWHRERVCRIHGFGTA